ncbi:unknown [Gryllus bimaculatus nudivirus]|uniref:Uncharacterized protein n=1 Tax=Gryllus bimaculatus nudivirus TaxID=432587 RepID=A4L219_9VIRU|nr:hypothetical protein GrBNV_gp56 [Gryllus bimaculatus nudivirus]ABO45389.1 unknown [Gryllus bimaculatus nudivirus]
MAETTVLDERDKEDILYLHFMKEKHPKRQYRKNKRKLQNQETFTRVFKNSEDMVNFAKLNIYKKNSIESLELAEMILCCLAFNCYQENSLKSWSLTIEYLQIYQFNFPVFVILQELGSKLLIEVLKMNRNWKIKNNYISDDKKNDLMFCSNPIIDINMLKTFKLNRKKRPNILKYDIFE